MKLSADGQPIDIITEDDSLKRWYSSTIALIPEHRPSLLILADGSNEAMEELREKVIATLVPAAEEVVRTWAQDDYNYCDGGEVEFELDYLFWGGSS